MLKKHYYLFYNYIFLASIGGHRNQNHQEKARKNRHAGQKRDDTMNRG